MSSSYRVQFGSPRAELEIAKFLKRLSVDIQQHLYGAMRDLGVNPVPQQTKRLSQEILIFGRTARYRLRIGHYRILYDIDDKTRTVVILAVRRRSEKTYH